MKNIVTYLIIALLLACGFGYIQYSLNKKHKADAKRWEQNYSETSKQVQQLNMTFNEFEKTMDSKTDSILKIAHIKPKHVTQITNYNTYYTDTTISVIKPNYEPLTGTYPFTDKQGCFEFGGFIEMNDTIPELNVENRAFESDFYDIEHYRKDTMHFLWLDWVKWWQTPEITYTIIDKCTGNKRIKKFNVK